MRNHLIAPVAEWKAVTGGAGELEGYASVFGNVDQGGDVVLPGAFRKTLAEWKTSRQPLPLIADHDLSTDGVIGSVKDAREDPVGLFVRAAFSSDAKAQSIRMKMIEGHLRGMSFTYEAIKHRMGDVGGKSARLLEELKLFEATVTPFPMNTLALASAKADTKKPYGDVTYADPGYQADGVHRYPLDSEAHCRSAWSYINQADNAAKYSSEHLALVKGRIRAALEKYGAHVSASSLDFGSFADSMLAALGIGFEPARKAAVDLLVDGYRTDFAAGTADGPGTTADAAAPEQDTAENKDAGYALGFLTPGSRDGAANPLSALEAARASADLDRVEAEIKTALELTMPDRYQDTMDKALQCIHLARAINDRYADPSQMPAEEVANRKSLLTEAMRLQEIADTELKQAKLESWAATPDADMPAVAAMASKAMTDAKLNRGADQFAEANLELTTRRFAKALKGGVASLNAEEKASIIENSTGQIIVPHDLAGPIFLQLPRLGVLRDLALVRPTTSNLVDVRALTGVTAGWGQIEITNTGGATPPTDAAIAASGPNTVTVQDLVAMVQIGTDELMDTDANLVSLVQEIVGQKFAEMEDDAFANGNGTSKPFGIAIRATIGGAIPAAQGVTAATSAVILPDDLKKLQYVILARFANVGSYLGSDGATQAIALLKDSTSNYLWQPSNQAGQPDRLFGRAYYRVTGLPAPGSAPAVLFGDIRSGYLIADRQRITVQRLDERYADQGLVAFLFRERVGGDVIRPAAFAKYLV